jgi:hypothetical protein
MADLCAVPGAACRAIFAATDHYENAARLNRRNKAAGEFVPQRRME